MKKNLLFYIPLGVSVALGAVLLVTWLKRRSDTLTMDSQPRGKDYLNTPDADVYKKFKGFNPNLLLNKNTPDGKAEITLLQHFINAYYGGTPSLLITGVFDTPTRNAVMDITGKDTTSIYEFNYIYLQPVRGAALGDKIMMELTERY